MTTSMLLVNFIEIFTHHACYYKHTITMHLIHVNRCFIPVIIFALYVVYVAILLPIITSVKSVARIVWMAQMMTEC